MKRGHARRGSTTHESSLRSRYLQVMSSNAGALPWNNASNRAKDYDDDDDDVDMDDEGESIGMVSMPELSEDLATTTSLPRMLNDLSEANLSRPANFDLGRSQSLNAVGVVAVHDVRVSSF